MFVKFRKSEYKRSLFLNGAMIIETEEKTIAIGRENKECSNEKTIAFDIAIAEGTDKEMVKRFVKSAYKYAKDNRRINYCFTETKLNMCANLAFQIK